MRAGMPCFRCATQLLLRITRYTSLRLQKPKIPGKMGACFPTRVPATDRPGSEDSATCGSDVRLVVRKAFNRKARDGSAKSAKWTSESLPKQVMTGDLMQ